ncbi:MAG: autotransporter-associated beta strand repeat-containing protein [Alphaproteobacteria bacterium]|nr:autotransporter-associated beta strand repeat-containing protein [Alphaproteobacteria bacterium]
MCVSILAMTAVLANPAQATDDISGSGSLTAPQTNNIVNGSVYSGVISGTGNVTVTAGNANFYGWELTGVNTFNGQLDIQTGANVEFFGASSDLATASVLVESGGQLTSLSNQTVTDLSGAGTVLIVNGSTLTDHLVNGSTFSGNIEDSSGSGNFAVTGNGTLTLSGINSYSGTTTVGSGATLSVSSVLNIENSSSVVLNSGTLSVTGTGQTFSNAITVAGTGGELSVANGMTDTFSGNISGTSGLNINTGTTTGTVTLSGTNTSFSGNIVVESGTLAVGNGTNLGSGIVYLTTAAALQINGTGAVGNTIWANGGGTSGEGTLGINAGGVTLSGALGNSTNYLADLNINNIGTTVATGVVNVATINC